MIKNICYITYQTFPANTANSLQTISNIKYFVKNECNVSLIYPLREKNSSDSIQEIHDFYNISEPINIKAIKHNYPFGKIKLFKRFMFHISHFLWAKKTVKNLDTTLFDFYITRSDWLLYFLLKTTNKTVVFECHKNSKLRKIILHSCLKKPNAKVIYLNENLKKLYKKVNSSLNSIVLHNGVDLENFKSPLTKKKDIVFVGNLERFSKSRNLKFAIDGFIKSELSDSFSLNIIGGPDRASNSLRDYVDKNYLNEKINILGQLERKETLIFLNKASIGILINDSKDAHSYFHSSPLKYFEYLASNLKIIASDFPAHKDLPYSENIIYYDQNSLESFSRALEQTLIEENEIVDLYKISLDFRAKSILEFIES